MNTVHSDSTAPAETNDIVATQVPDGYRLAFLPRHFGRHFMQVESSIFGHMRNLCPDYTGGYWEFFDLSNGGCYITPRGESYVLRAPNGFEGTVTGEVAGLIASLYAFSHLSFKFESEEVFAERYHQLRDFALDHAEAATILEAID